MFSGERVRQAREICGLTQEELGVRILASQWTVSKIESNKLVPTGHTLDRLLFTLSFPLGFFKQGPPPEFPLGSLAWHNEAVRAELDKVSEDIGVCQLHRDWCDC